MFNNIIRELSKSTTLMWSAASLSFLFSIAGVALAINALVSPESAKRFDFSFNSWMYDNKYLTAFGAIILLVLAAFYAAFTVAMIRQGILEHKKKRLQEAAQRTELENLRRSLDHKLEDIQSRLHSRE
jgi:hypothetical protein